MAFSWKIATYLKRKKMRKGYLLFLLPLMSFVILGDSSFKQEQLEYYRVYEAFKDKNPSALGKLNAAGINSTNYDLFLRAFKFEEDLEVWAKNKEDNEYTLLTTYKFCENVGELGPKRKEGDKQIPEGVYHISKFNPTSQYFLSLKINYPNISDRILGDEYSPGGQIFIHGGCSTIGCIPITDEWIKELYVLCVQAKNQGQEQIPVHIFPARLTNENMNLLQSQFSSSKNRFWKQLKPAFDYFESKKELPKYLITEDGEYVFNH